jgi:very-short-patch-repair endonuclease
MFCTKEQKQADDELKDQQLQSLGWKVLRVINDDVNKNLCDIIKIIKGE